MSNNKLHERLTKSGIQYMLRGVVKDAWEAVLLMCEMFDQTARELACAFGYAYDDGEGEAAFAFLKHVKQLPKDASDIGHVEK